MAVPTGGHIFNLQDRMKHPTARAIPTITPPTVATAATQPGSFKKPSDEDSILHLQSAGVGESDNPGGVIEVCSSDVATCPDVDLSVLSTGKDDACFVGDVRVRLVADFCSRVFAEMCVCIVTDVGVVNETDTSTRVATEIGVCVADIADFCIAADVNVCLVKDGNACLVTSVCVVTDATD